MSLFIYLSVYSFIRLCYHVLSIPLFIWLCSYSFVHSFFVSLFRLDVFVTKFENKMSKPRIVVVKKKKESETIFQVRIAGSTFNNALA